MQKINEIVGELYVELRLTQERLAMASRAAAAAQQVSAPGDPDVKQEEGQPEGGSQEKEN